MSDGGVRAEQAYQRAALRRRIVAILLEVLLLFANSKVFSVIVGARASQRLLLFGLEHLLYDNKTLP
ncbi:hypothetical protein AJ88_24775 [Mesorhizobium amorphae CCBAU 01583]|nr:hypothetical protein AJ88_24775 [Mesorhizobium amorphae CCBAU 01583]